MEQCKIYVLKDPITNAVKYVGKTTLPLEDRLRAHRSQKTKNRDSKKELWIKELWSNGCEPIIEQVELVPKRFSCEKEKQWIVYYASICDELFNSNGLTKTRELNHKPTSKPIRKTLGGKKGKSGRKPLDDKKIAVQVYFYQSNVEAVGGLDKAREIALKALEKEYAKIILEKD